MTKRQEERERRKQRFYRSRAWDYSHRWLLRILLVVAACVQLLALLFPDVLTLPGIPPDIMHRINEGFLSVGFLVLLLMFVYELFFEQYWKGLTHYHEVYAPKLEKRLERYDMVKAARKEMGLGKQPCTWTLITAKYSDADLFCLGLRLEDHSQVFLFAKELTPQEKDQFLERFNAGKITFRDMVENYEWTPTPISDVPLQEEMEGL